MGIDCDILTNDNALLYVLIIDNPAFHKPLSQQHVSTAVENLPRKVYTYIQSSVWSNAHKKAY